MGAAVITLDIGQLFIAACIVYFVYACWTEGVS
jgi:hypothetical protein